jgi:hypothetical protein
MQDYAAPWFRARRQRGIDDTIYYGMIEPEKQRRHVFSVPHEHCDGVGAFMRLLRRLPLTSWQGVSGRPAQIPSLRECWRKQRAAPAPVAPCWRHATPAADAARQHIALAHFSVAETQALRSEAKSRSVSLNALLMAALHDLVTSQLLSQGGGGWFVPVTLRGALSLPSDEMNHASGVYLSLPAQADSSAIQQQLTEAIRRDEHWWMWHQSRLVVNLGGQWLVNRLLGWLGQRRYLGSFSSMGEWNIDWRGSGLADDTLMWGAPPGSPNYPVAACWLICNGRLVLVLKLNAVLGLSAARCEALMQSWQRSMLSLLSPAEAGIEMTESCHA